MLMFIDRAKIIVVSGAGGDGMVSFRREKYVPRGGPSGGDGGRGGSVIIRADGSLNTLINFRRHRKFAAKAGANGGAKEMFGKNGKTCMWMFRWEPWFMMTALVNYWQI